MFTQSTEPLYQALQCRGHRVTSQRRTILEIIAGRKGRFTANDILTDVEKEAPFIGRATVFRTLDLLARFELLRKVHESEGCHSYVLCNKTHHHHLVCSNCGLVVEVSDCRLIEQARELSLATNFRIDGHYLEYFGICGSCQKE